MIDLKAPPFALLAERDMDLMLVEEMHSSAPFREWLVGKLYNGTRQFRRFIGAWHTPTLEPLGSIDILFVFEERSGRKCAILIENKIDQPKQNLQAQRYFEIGEKGVIDGLWDEYLTCLFSPQAYFSSLEPSEYFSSYLSYEEIEEWFSRAAVDSRSVTPERASYKKTLIRKAIEQGTGMVRGQMQQYQQPAYHQPMPSAPIAPTSFSQNSQAQKQPATAIGRAKTASTKKLPVNEVREPVPQEQPVATKKKSSISDFRVFPGGVFNLPAGYREAEDTTIGKFWAECLSFAKQNFPELGMVRPTGSAEEAAWVEFAPDEFPREVKIIHKMPQGFMDLSFAMTPLAMIQQPYQPYIDNDMTFKENGKTAVIRITVPLIDPQEGFDKQKDLIGFSMQKAQKLYQLYMHVINSGSSRGYAPEELFL